MNKELQNDTNLPCNENQYLNSMVRHWNQILHKRICVLFFFFVPTFINNEQWEWGHMLTLRKRQQFFLLFFFLVYFCFSLHPFLLLINDHHSSIHSLIISICQPSSVNLIYTDNILILKLLFFFFANFFTLGCVMRVKEKNKRLKWLCACIKFAYEFTHCYFH